MENIVDALRLCQRDCKEAQNASKALAIVNMAVLKKDSARTIETMKNRSDMFSLAKLQMDISISLALVEI